VWARCDILSRQSGGTSGENANIRELKEAFEKTQESEQGKSIDWYSPTAMVRGLSLLFTYVGT
jgi:hypothetical protein